MVREIVLGNGGFLVNIDRWLQIRDVFFPFVGQYNHLNGHAHKIGLMENHKFIWLNDDSWKRTISYQKDCLVTDNKAINKEIGLQITFNDTVVHNKNILLRKITINNEQSKKRNITLFFHQDFHLYGDGIGDTALFHPISRSIIHYKKSTYFLLGLNSEEEESLIKDYEIGEHVQQKKELKKTAIAQGNVDSLFSTTIELEPVNKKIIYFYLIAGECFEEVFSEQKYLLEKTPEALLQNTKNHHKNWLQKIKPNISIFSQDLQQLFKKSLLIINTQIDKGGAIIAANDSDNMQFNKDTYSYMWPRDGALVAISLIKAGYPEIAVSFFRFCSEVVHKDGFLLHKYNPDRTLGSSWHPWVFKDKHSLPIQEDETALCLHALWVYYKQTNDKELIKELYDSFIKPAGEFLADYRYDNGLPKESYDLWEERRGIFVFTIASVVAGLDAAEKLGQIVKDKKFCDVCVSNRIIIKNALTKYFYESQEGYFMRSVSFENGIVEKDTALDSSVYALFEFDILDVSDEMLVSTMRKVNEWLRIKTNIGGIARYYKDYYHKKSEDIEKIPGNPWIICTLWYAKYLIKKASNQEELNEAMSLLNWTCEHASTTNTLAEQIHPITGEPLSVSPLTWSHAELIDTMTNYANKYDELSKKRIDKK